MQRGIKTMNTTTPETRQYKDVAGNPVTLDWLVRNEPAWAANQIRHRDRIERERDEALKWQKQFGEDAVGFSKQCTELREQVEQLKRDKEVRMSPVRLKYLIHVAKTWNERAISQIELNCPFKAMDAIKQANEALRLLDLEIVQSEIPKPA